MAAVVPVSLRSVATSSPEHTILQEDAAAAAEHLFGDRYADFARLKNVFRTAGINKRQMARPIEWYLEARNWPDRSEAYLDCANELFLQAAQDALAKARLSASQIDTIVTVSSTGIATPGLEARALNVMPFRSNVRRVPVFGLGCAGGTSGLGLASRLEFNANSLARVLDKTGREILVG